MPEFKTREEYEKWKSSKQRDNVGEPNNKEEKDYSEKPKMGSYVESVISSGENVLYQAKISIWSMLPSFILGLISLPIFGLGLVVWVAAFIRYKTTELTITNKKIIAKFGFIRRDTIEILLPKIESIQVKQTLFGRLLNYGSIIVSGAGNPQAPVPGIDEPIQFRRRFMEIQEQSTK